MIHGVGDEMLQGLRLRIRGTGYVTRVIGFVIREMAYGVCDVVYVIFGMRCGMCSRR